MYLTSALVPAVLLALSPSGSPCALDLADDKGTKDATRTGVQEVRDVALRSTPESLSVHEALTRGLAFLAAQQATGDDGSFPAGQDETYAPVGVSALCALAFMAGGNTPGRGEYGAETAAVIDYLLSRVKPENDEHAGYIKDEADRHSQMHGHGLATLALAEAYSMSPGTSRGRKTAEALRAAVRRIEITQGTEGGWYYDPVRSIQHEGSITICLVQALRAARNTGFHVDTQVIARAIDYVKRLQNPDGSFRYGLDDKKVSVALTGACLSTLHATGIYDGKAVDDGYGYVWRQLTGRDVDRESGRAWTRPPFPYYERFYLSQAMWQHRDETVFRRWAGPETERVLASQRPNGSWGDARYGDSYATAMNCLFLALPDGLLPIFQR